eukprot:13098751-Alexandrium_andersonii.AAC.1
MGAAAPDSAARNASGSSACGLRTQRAMQSSGRRTPGLECGTFGPGARGFRVRHARGAGTS